MHPPLQLPPCRNPQCVSAEGASIVRRPAAEEKGPLVVNNSAVHSDHNGGTSHWFEHLFRVGICPLTALLQHWPYVPGERLNPWICCPATTCSQPPFLLSFLPQINTPLQCLSKDNLNSPVQVVQWDHRLFKNKNTDSKIVYSVKVEQGLIRHSWKEDAFLSWHKASGVPCDGPGTAAQFVATYLPLVSSSGHFSRACWFSLSA